MHYYSFIIVSLLFLFSCEYSKEFKKIDVDGKTEIQIPPYMNKTDRLRDDAILQYSNRFRNCYLIVLRNNKKKGLKSYQKDAVQVIFKYLDNPVVTDSIMTKIDDNRAFHNSIFGKMEEELIYYDHVTVETDDHFYEICAWTRGPERKEQYGPDLMKMVYSFRSSK